MHDKEGRRAGTAWDLAQVQEVCRRIRVDHNLLFPRLQIDDHQFGGAFARGVRDKHLILVDNAGVGHVLALIERLHAVHEMAELRQNALIHARGSWYHQHLRLIRGCGAEQLDPPNVIDRSKDGAQGLRGA